MPEAPSPSPTAGSPRCPLCNEPNQCGMAAGAPRCWCYDAVLPEELIEKLPEHFRGVVCICQKCVAESATRT